MLEENKAKKGKKEKHIMVTCLQIIIEGNEYFEDEQCDNKEE